MVTTTGSLRKLIFRRSNNSFFIAPSDRKLRFERVSTFLGLQLHEYRHPRKISGKVGIQVFSSGIADVMRWRLFRGNAFLLTLETAENEVAAFGWVQNWKPFRRRFSKISTSGWMLGFYHTSPSWRRKGLYGELLQESILRAPKDESIYIYCSTTNTASANGIAKAGFRYLGDLETKSFMRLLNVSKLYRAS